MPAEGLVPDLALTLNGAPAPPALQADVVSVRVEESTEELSTFALELKNWDDEALRPSWSDSSAVAPGVTVQISLGYLDDLHPLFTGEVTALEPVFGDEPPRLTVRGYDHGSRLALGRRTRAFLRQKDSAIASTLAREAGLRAQVKDSGNSHEYVIQGNRSNLEFLRERARLNGYELFVRDETLHFRPPPWDAQPALTLDLNELTGFAPRLSVFGYVPKVEVRGWDPLKMAPVVAARQAQGARSKGGQQVSVVTEAAPTAAHATAIAVGLAEQAAHERITGEAECLGRPELRAGTTVRITGAGSAFSGAYYVPAVTHTFTPDDGYRTTFELRRRPV